jgi:putative flippase GtrA
LNRSLFKQLVAFGLVGVIGFVIDSGTLYLARLAGLGLIVGRVISYLTAATSTWLLNRRFTFVSKNDHQPLREWALFMLSQLAGAAFNLGLYASLVTSNPMVAAHPVLGVAAGSLAGMLVNFFVARKFVFKEQ